VNERRYRVIGGLHDASAETWVANTTDEVRRALRSVARSGRTVSLASAQRSFGAQYLPAPGGVLLDLGELERGATPLETTADGTLWIRAGGGTRFSDLRQLFPGYRTSCPPTADSISLSGAISACTHSASGFFADSLRAFRLECANGTSYACRRDAPGLEGELFRHAVGAFGALGVMTDIELCLTPIAPQQKIVVNALYAGPSRTLECFDVLERAADDPRYREGHGVFIYGLWGHAITFGDELLDVDDPRRGPTAPLMGDDVTKQMFLQALGNRFPAFAEWIVARTFRQGAALHAPWYGFQFYQRSYDALHRVMSGTSGLASALRLAGVPRGLPICHTSWFFPRERLRAFVTGYFEILSRYPTLVHRIEQQDIVLLPPSRWPCHSLGETAGKLGIFTATFSVRPGERSQSEAEEFARAVTRDAPSFAPGTRVSLCKQIHAEPEVLRAMHRDYANRLEHYRALVDPAGIVRSRFLAELGLR
jgi:FAD/FMN-containing dehydrogenase